jgi:hypothetical protein
MSSYINRKSSTGRKEPKIKDTKGLLKRSFRALSKGAH